MILFLQRAVAGALQIRAVASAKGPAHQPGPQITPTQVSKRGFSTRAAFPPSKSTPSTQESRQPNGFNDVNLEHTNLSAAPSNRNLLNLTKLQRKSGDSLFKLAATLFCNALESAVVESLHKEEIQKSLPGLCGNYAPAEEYGPSAPLQVIGTLPSCLNGELLRVGPNPKFKPKAKYSWFDGDGMLHGIRIKDEEVSYTARYVRTARLSQEEYYGAAMFMKVGDCSGRQGLFWVLLQILRVMLGLLDISNGWGTANTALVFHGGQLLCLQETDKPYSIRVHDNGDLETLGHVTYDRKLNHPFSAHPKVDPVTGEMFVLGSSLDALTPPFVHYRVVSKGGEMRDPVTITTSAAYPPMMHDFAITEHYALFLDCPLHFKPRDMVLKNQDVFWFDESKSTRIGVLSRYAGDEEHIRWFDLPACLILHTANAWEEGDEIVLIGCRNPGTSLEKIDELIDETLNMVRKPFVNELYEFRLNMKTAKASQKQLVDVMMDFPRINPSYLGRKNQYVYTSVSNFMSNNILGIAKFDLTLEPELGKEKLEPGGNLVGIFWFGEQRFGSEAVFVAADGRENSGSTGDEDEGYLLVVVYDERKGKSDLVVIDAKTMSADPVAVVQLPTRVPYGFHGLFLSEKELNEQGNFSY